MDLSETAGQRRCWWKPRAQSIRPCASFEGWVYRTMIPKAHRSEYTTATDPTIISFANQGPTTAR